MAKSVLELAVGTGQWDAGLRKAKSALDNFTQSQGGLQQALAKDSENLRKFVSMMGQTESTAKTAKGQMNDYKATIEQLTMQYNRMTDAQKKSIGQDYIQSIDQLKQKYQAVNEEIQEMNRSLNNVKAPDIADGVKAGGLFGGGKLDNMLSVFGGNLMTKGASMLVGLGEEMAGMVRQGVELAKQGEGIRIAFERLGRGDILNGLREATHGTVTDLELMKAAVKFNDFKLPLDELGTMLAFAQQKAKDSGQSVDYMVDSIVTGLGRKSLMILDNLGLSATEIRERMKETGDMTKAVGEIIREQMAKAGDYVETAADRAAQANVSLQNKMEELGRKFAPVEEASNQLWTSMKIGILDIIGGPLARLLNGLTEAGRINNSMQKHGGNDRVSGQVQRYRVAKANGSSYMANYIDQQNLKSYDDEINRLQFTIAAYGKGRDAIEKGNIARLKEELQGVRDLRAEYIKMRNEADRPSAINSPTTTTTSSGSGSKTTKADLEKINGLIPEAEAKVKSIQEQIQQSWDEGRIEELNGELVKAQEELKRLQDLGKPIDFDRLFPMKNLENDQTSTPSLSTFDKAVESARTRISDKNISVDQQSIDSLLSVIINRGIGNVMVDSAPFAQIFASAMNIPDEYFEEFSQQFGEKMTATDLISIFQSMLVEGMNIPEEAFEELQEQLNEHFEDNPVKINLETGEIEDADKDKKKKKDDPVQAMQKFTGGISSIASGLNAMGIELPKEIEGAISAMNGVISIITGVSQIITLFQGTKVASEAALITSIDALTAVLVAKSFLFFQQGGIVHAAQGFSGTVPGMSFSGDNIPIMANAGEVVLTRAQAGVIADAVSGGGGGGGVLYTEVSGDALRIVLDRSSRKRSKGTYMTTKMKN